MMKLNIAAALTALLVCACEPCEPTIMKNAAAQNGLLQPADSVVLTPEKVAPETLETCAARLEQNGFELLLTANETKAAVCSPVTTFEALSVLQTLATAPAQKAIGSFGGTDELLKPAQNFFAALNSFKSLNTAQLLMYRTEYASLPQKAFEACSRGNFCTFYACNDLAQYVPTINTWVNKETFGMIRELATEGDIDPNTVLALASACAFNGTWKEPFERKPSESYYFYLPGDQEVEVPTMSDKRDVLFARDGDFSMIQLPFTEEGIVIEMYLPDAVLAPHELVKQLTPEKLQTLRQKLALERKLDIGLPLMKIESDYNLIPFLKTKECGILFDYNQNPFAPIAKNSKLEIALSVAKQKAIFELDEKGVRAAAADLMVANFRMMPQAKRFIVNKPFAFTIRAQKDAMNLTLFCGYYLPEKQ